MLPQRQLSPSLQERLLPSQMSDKHHQTMLEEPWFVHCPLPPPWLYPASNSISSLSQSTKEKSKISAGKRDGPSISKSSKKRIKSNLLSSFDSEAKENDAPIDDGYEDKEADYVPNIMEEKGTWEADDGIIQQHRKAIMLTAFPPVKPHQSFDKPQSKSASIAQCRPQSEVDYIKYVVQNWQKGTEICTVQEGEEKSELLHFRHKHKLGI